MAVTDPSQQQPPEQQPGQTPPPPEDSHTAAKVVGTAVVGGVALSLLPKPGMPGALATDVIVRMTTKLLTAFRGFQQRREHEFDDELRREALKVEPTLGEALAQILAAEAGFEATFRAKQIDRLQAGLPKALAIVNPDERKKAVQQLIEKERRFTRQREEAMRQRVIMAARNWKVKQDSPDGALWLLGEAATHTPDCVYMANKVWPWSVLDHFAPPVHPRCACSLVPLGLAKEKGLVKSTEVPPDAEARADFVQKMTNLGLQEAHWMDRWPAGTSNAGRFKPRFGGDPGRALMHRLRRGRVAHLDGHKREVYRDEHFSERIGGHAFESPQGTTDVYRDGALLSGGMDPGPVRHAISVVRAHLQEMHLRRGGAPLRAGDGPEHVVNMPDLGYRPTGMWSLGHGRWKMMFRHHASGATAEAVITKRGVESAEHDTVPIPSQKSRKLLHSPRSWADHVQDAHAWARELADVYGADLHLGDVKPDKTFEDHAGFHEWDGTVHLGRDVRRDIERAAKTRARGRPLSHSELRGIYASYRATAHEIAHGVNPISPGLYHNEDGMLEEVLAEEMAHRLTVQRLLDQGQGDVVAWAHAHAKSAPVVGVYLPGRGALADILDAAGVPQAERGKLLTELKFKTRPRDRFAFLGGLLKRTNPDLTDKQAENEARSMMSETGSPRSVLGTASPKLPKKFSKFVKQQQKPISQPWVTPPVTLGGGPPVKQQGPIPSYDDKTLTLSSAKIIGQTAQKAKDENGDRWVVQQHEGNYNRVATELLANSVYRKLGIASPPGGTITTPGAPDFSQIPDALASEPKLPDTIRLSSGVLLRDKKGRVTIIEPRNHYGGYVRTFPKGGVEKGLTPQQNALKELWEETGLHAHITGVLGDYQGDTGVTRYYTGVLTGGKLTPSSETAAIENLPPDEAGKLLNKQRDQEILGDLLGTPIPQGRYPDVFPPVVPGVAAAYPATPGVKNRKLKANEPDLANGYMADALVGNWSPVGGSYADNLRFDDEGHAVRVNPAATFEYSPRGNDKQYGPVPMEAWALMNKGEYAGVLHPTDEQLREQAQHIADTLTDDEIDGLVDAAPFRDQQMRERIRTNLKARRDWMARYAEGSAALPEPPSNEAARAVHRQTQARFDIYPEESQALADYAASPEPVDSYIASPKGSPPPDVDRIVKHLDNVLEDSKTGGDTYAFMPLSGDPPPVGDTVKLPGYPRLMTSEPAAQLRSTVLAKVLIPEGAHAYFDETADDGHDLLLPRNARFKITEHRTVNGHTYVGAVLQPHYRPGPLYLPPWKPSKPMSYGTPKPKVKPKVKPTSAGVAWGNKGTENAWRVDDVVRIGDLHGVVTDTKYANKTLTAMEVALDNGKTVRATSPGQIAQFKEPHPISDEDWNDGLHDGEDFQESFDELDEDWREFDEKRGWHGLPFDEQTGQGPNERDTPPERTENGDFVVYHGTSKDGAQHIQDEGRLRPDDLNMVGFSTTPGGAQSFAAMKHGPVMRLIIPQDEMANHLVRREIGGSGHDQFLIGPKERHGHWAGVHLSRSELLESWEGYDEKRKLHELPEVAWHEPPHPYGKPHERKGGGMTAVGVTNTKLGDTVEDALQTHFGMANEHPDRRQGPLDVRMGEHGYEVKTVSQAASEYKAKPKKWEIESKKQYAAEHHLKPHTMIVVYSPGERAMHVYSKEGIGAYRLTGPENGWHYHGAVPLDLGDHPDPVAKLQEAWSPEARAAALKSRREHMLDREPTDQSQRMIGDLEKSGLSGDDATKAYIHGDLADSKTVHTVNGSYSPERTELHKRIIRRFLDGTTGQEHPEAVFTAGGGASGKSGLAGRSKIPEANLPVPAGHVYVNPDEVMGMLPEYDHLRKDHEDTASAALHEEASDVAAQVAKIGLRTHRHLVVDGVGNTSVEKFGGKIKAAQREGYKVQVRYAHVSLQEAMAREKKRAEETGRHVNESVLRQQHQTVAQVYRDGVKDLPGVHVQIYDTHGTPKLIAERKPGMASPGSADAISIKDPGKYKEVLEKANG